MYANDILLMSTTFNGLQKLVDKCIETSKSMVPALTLKKLNFVYKKVAIQINYITMDSYTIRPTGNQSEA